MSDLAKFILLAQYHHLEFIINKIKVYYKFSLLIPMKRIIKSDIKNFVDFLINDEQKYMTGQNLLIDGKDNHIIGLDDKKTFIIAEIGINHNGSLDIAKTN